MHRVVSCFFQIMLEIYTITLCSDQKSPWDSTWLDWSAVVIVESLLCIEPWVYCTVDGCGCTILAWPTNHCKKSTVRTDRIFKYTTVFGITLICIHMTHQAYINSPAAPTLKICLKIPFATSFQPRVISVFIYKYTKCACSSICLEISFNCILNTKIAYNSGVERRDLNANIL